MLWLHIRQQTERLLPSTDHTEPMELGGRPQPHRIEGMVGWWTADKARCEDWEPLLDAMGFGWVARKLIRNLSPDVELYFTGCAWLQLLPLCCCSFVAGLCLAIGSGVEIRLCVALC